MDARSVGECVRNRRKQLGLRQTDLAAAAGVSYRFVLDLEAGKESCQLGKVLRVLDMLGVRVRFEAGPQLSIGRGQATTEPVVALGTGTVDRVQDEGDLAVDLE